MSITLQFLGVSHEMIISLRVPCRLLDPSFDSQSFRVKYITYELVRVYPSLWNLHLMLGTDTVPGQGVSARVHEDLITDACKLDGTVPATCWAVTTTFISLAANQECCSLA